MKTKTLTTFAATLLFAAHSAHAEQSAAETRRLLAQARGASCAMQQSQAETQRLLAMEARARERVSLVLSTAG